MSAIQYFIKRTLVTVVLLFLVASVIFLLFRLMPGSYLDYMAGSGANAEALNALREKWGLDEPLYVQYWTYVTNMLSGDMGTSYVYRESVLSVTGTAIRNSFILVAPAITTVYILGSAIGAVLGTIRGRIEERAGIVGLTMIGTIPEFFTGIMLLIVFAFWFDIFPTSGMMPVTYRGDSVIEMVQTEAFWLHYTLPFMTILIKLTYFPTLMMRTSIIEVLGQDFIYYNKMKGISKRRRIRHLMKHASLPVITLYPITMASAIGGLVVIETVFNWPGIGYLLVDAVFARDYPVVQFVFFLVGAWVILGNYLVDLLYSVIDPRIIIEGQESG